MPRTTAPTPAAIPMEASHEKMNIVIVGHVDHGKSTLVGRLLADTGSLPEGKLEAVRENCRLNAKPFEYAFLIDALSDEQSQGITIDAARVFFKSRKRHYILIDAPGHIEFLKNMVTGASRAESALLVIDAKDGIQENSRRHGYLLGLLGVRHVAVVVNKMDLVDFSQAVFDAIRAEFTEFLQETGVTPAAFIPVSGMTGDNVAGSGSRMPWHTGGTILEALDAFQKEPPLDDQPFRMPVQDVYKFTQFRDDRRIVAGTLLGGRLRPGQEVVFLPSGKKSQVNSLEVFNAPTPAVVSAGQTVGFTLREQIYVQRGEIASLTGEPPPKVSSRIRISLFWLGRRPMQLRKEYVLRLGTARVKARLEAVNRVMDASSLATQENKGRVERHDVAECVLSLGKALAFDLATENKSTSRFVIVDEYEICGGGIILEALPDAQKWVRDKVILRNYKWEPGLISMETRQERYSQRPALIIVTGAKEAEKKRIAKELESTLFTIGRLVYYLGIGSVLYGVDADIRSASGESGHAEQIRRLGEIAHILLDAGVILILTMVDMTAEDLEVLRTVVNPDLIETVLVGDHALPGVSYTLQVMGGTQAADSVREIKTVLQDRGILYR